MNIFIFASRVRAIKNANTIDILKPKAISFGKYFLWQLQWRKLKQNQNYQRWKTSPSLLLVLFCSVITFKCSLHYAVSLYLIFHMLIKLIFFILLFFSFLFFFICGGFCHTLKWNSQGFTCVPHPNPPSHLPLHPFSLGFPSAPGPSACLMHPTWAGDLFHPR